MGIDLKTYDGIFADKTPEKGDICLNDLGEIGVITEVLENEAFKYVGIQLAPDKAGQPWASPKPRVITPLESLAGDYKDYQMVVDHCIKAYLWMSDGMIGNCLTLPEVVIQLAQDNFDKMVDEIMDEEGGDFSPEEAQWLNDLVTSKIDTMRLVNPTKYEKDIAIGESIKERLVEMMAEEIEQSKK